MVIDASVVAKWYLVEEKSHLAKDFIEDHSLLLAPALLQIEVINAIVKAQRIERIERQYAKAAIAELNHSLDDRIITLYPNKSLIEQATDIALTHSHQLQDCLYIALAKVKFLPILTSDEKQADIAKCLGLCVNHLF